MAPDTDAARGRQARLPHEIPLAGWRDIFTRVKSEIGSDHVSLGSASAATLWILVSIGFAFYVGTFGTYGKTYGALGGVIALLSGR